MIPDSTCFKGVPHFCVAKQFLKSTMEDLPSRRTIVLDVTAKSGDGGERLPRRRGAGNRRGRHHSQRAKLGVRQYAGTDGRSVHGGEASQCEELRRDGQDDREEVEDSAEALDLAALDAAAALERLVVLLNHPPRAIAVDNRLDLPRSRDRLARDELPIDGRFAAGRILLEDMNEVEAKRFGCGFARTTRITGIS